MESSLENIINETSKEFGKVSIEDIQTRHRKERKELQAKIQALKKNAPKSDKKKRKEALEEIAKMESDLEKKQEQEIKDAESEIKSEQPAEVAEEQPSILNEEEDNENEQQLPQQRVSKAQKRRDKKAREARQREEEIKASAEDALQAPKAVEGLKMQAILTKRGLATHNIPSDGDCLYNAIRHQLIQHGLATLTVKELRTETANYIQANKDNLIPYMTHPETGDLLKDDEFEKYCNDIRSTPAWGGQIELKALSSILKVPIEVIQADGSPTIQGAEYGGAPLVITYHRHMYSLGEHYNSTVPLVIESNKDDNNGN
ncbi:hypothetical protein DOY81_005638 [Sarcophaga bullata]|nr:hypothetical protein DOY81_005638 [Sarcophaga bullata]